MKGIKRHECLMQRETKAKQAVYYVPSLITAYGSLLKLPVRASGSKVIVINIEHGNKKGRTNGISKKKFIQEFLFFFHINFCNCWFFVIAQEIFSERAFQMKRHDEILENEYRNKSHQYLLNFRYERGSNSISYMVQIFISNIINKKIFCLRS